jgi:energy-coupling factor transporter ATP-binding protein EcfA2
VFHLVVLWKQLTLAGDIDAADADDAAGLLDEGVTTWLSEKANGHFVQWSAVHAVDAGGRVVPLVFAGTKSVGHAMTLPDLVGTAVLSCGALVTTSHIVDLLQLLREFLREVMTSSDGDGAGHVGLAALDTVLEVLTARTVLGECVTAQHLVFPANEDGTPRGPELVFFGGDLPPVFPKVRRQNMVLSARLQSFRGGYNCEGYVLETVSRAGAVVRRRKYKTWWYVLCRCLRELYRDGDTAEITMAKLRLRAAVLNERTLHVSLDTLQRWLDAYFAPLVHYMKNSRVPKSRIAFDGEGFAPVLREFQVASGVSAADLAAMFVYDGPKPSAKALAYGIAAAKKAKAAAEAAASAREFTGGNLMVVLLTGPPGSGKSALAAAVSEALRRLAGGSALAVVSLSQDQFSRGGLDREASKKFFNALAEAVAHPEVRYIVVHRCNVMAGEVDQVCTAIRSERSGRGLYARLVVVKPAETGTPELLALCLAGVVKPDRKHHVTMGALAAEEAMRVAFMFWEASRDSDKPRVDHTMVPLNLLAPGGSGAGGSSGASGFTAGAAWARIVDGVKAAVAKLGEGYRGKMAFRRPKDALALPAALVDALKTCTVQPQRPVADLCAELVLKLQQMQGGGGGVGAASAGAASAGAASAGAAGGAGAAGAGDASGVMPPAKRMAESGVQYVCIKLRRKVPLNKEGTGVTRLYGGQSVQTTADHVTLKYAPSAEDMKLWLPWLDKEVLVSVAGLYLRKPDLDLSATKVTVVRCAASGGPLPAELLPANPHITLQFAPKTATPAQSGDLVNAADALESASFGFEDLPGTIEVVLCK